MKKYLGIGLLAIIFTGCTFTTDTIYQKPQNINYQKPKIDTTNTTNTSTTNRCNNCYNYYPNSCCDNRGIFYLEDGI